MSGNGRCRRACRRLELAVGVGFAPSFSTANRPVDTIGVAPRTDQHDDVIDVTSLSALDAVETVKQEKYIDTHGVDDTQVSSQDDFARLCRVLIDDEGRRRRRRRWCLRLSLRRCRRPI